jgi:hypothetical protein
LSEASGLRNEAKNINTILDSFELFINERIISIITLHTNEEICRNKSKYKSFEDCEGFIGLTNESEIKAVLGLLLAAGLYGSGHTNLNDIWKNNGFGIPIFKLVMSQKRFEFLICCLRFDDKNTRDDRLKTSRIAAIKEVWDELVSNCKRMYSLSESVTIDEMLRSFRGRCGFVQYMPKKPAKYGIKIFMLCDAVNKYMSNAVIYSGKNPNGLISKNISTNIVLELSENIKNTGRNITTDNWFTSVKLAEELLQRNLTLVGTIKKK